MRIDVVVAVKAGGWAFQPQTEKARRWMEHDFDRLEIIVPEERRSNLVRALNAEGLETSLPEVLVGITAGVYPGSEQEEQPKRATSGLNSSMSPSVRRQNVSDTQQPSKPR